MGIRMKIKYLKKVILLGVVVGNISFANDGSYGNERPTLLKTTSYANPDKISIYEEKVRDFDYGECPVEDELLKENIFLKTTSPQTDENERKYTRIIFDWNNFEEAAENMIFKKKAEIKAAVERDEAFKLTKIVRLGSYLSQLKTYDLALDGLEFESGLWWNNYGGIGEVKASNNIKFDHNVYESILGWNSEPVFLGADWQVKTSLYLGYLGSSQQFENKEIDLHQNGGVIGLSSQLAMRAFFVEGTLNVGYHEANSRSLLGKQSFNNVTAGLALKSGYNFKFYQELLAIEPNCLISYSFVNSSFKRNDGYKFLTDKSLGGWQINPGIKMIGNVSDSLKLDVHANMVWNWINDRNKGIAEQKEKIKPYVNYGLGVEKSISKRLLIRGSLNLLNGGINEVNVQLGLSYLFN